jgi:hypothetical protein
MPLLWVSNTVGLLTYFCYKSYKGEKGTAQFVALTLTLQLFLTHRPKRWPLRKERRWMQNVLRNKEWLPRLGSEPEKNEKLCGYNEERIRTK